MGLREWPPDIEFENLSFDQFKLVRLENPIGVNSPSKRIRIFSSSTHFGTYKNADRAVETIAEMGIGVAADLHLAVSSPEIVLPGTIPITSTAEMVVTKVAGHKYLDDLIKRPFRFEKGVLYVPDGPGLGIEVDEAKIAKYRIG